METKNFPPLEYPEMPPDLFQIALRLLSKYF